MIFIGEIFASQLVFLIIGNVSRRVYTDYYFMNVIRCISFSFVVIYLKFSLAEYRGRYM